MNSISGHVSGLHSKMISLSFNEAILRQVT